MGQLANHTARLLGGIIGSVVPSRRFVTVPRQLGEFLPKDRALFSLHAGEMVERRRSQLFTAVELTPASSATFLIIAVILGGVSLIHHSLWIGRVLQINTGRVFLALVHYCSCIKHIGS